MEIFYDRSRKRVRQSLGTIETYQFESDFATALSMFQKAHDVFMMFTKEPHEITETNYRGAAYLDGEKCKKVIFDYIRIHFEDGYDGSHHFEVIGERDMLPEELAVIDSEKLAEEKQEKAMLRKLLKKYPDEA